MKSLFIFPLLTMLMMGNVFSQDIIYFKDGSELKVKVVSIAENKAITYKKWDNQQGPDYSQSPEKVVMIIYENGTKEMFTVESNKAEEKPQPMVQEKVTPAEKKNSAGEIDRSPGFITFGVVGAFAVGSYGAINGNDAEYASSGVGFKMDVGGSFGKKKFIGINTTLAYIRSFGNEFAFANDFNFPESGVDFPGWHNTFLVTGLMLSVWPKNEIAIDLNIQPLGMIISSQKEITLVGQGGIGSVDQSTAVGPAMKFGIASRVMMNNFVFTGYFDFMYGGVTHYNVASRVNGSIFEYGDYDSFPMLLTVGVGVGYAF